MSKDILCFQVSRDLRRRLSYILEGPSIDPIQQRIFIRRPKPIAVLLLQPTHEPLRADTIIDLGLG
jgi:hypothetical protein